jgi:hypothetical protein
MVGELLEMQETDSIFDALKLIRDLDHKPIRVQNGRVVLRRVVTTEDGTGLEINFLDLHIGTSYTPELRASGTLGYVTVLSGSIDLTAESQMFHLESRDSMRFRADLPHSLDNPTNAASHMLLIFQECR